MPTREYERPVSAIMGLLSRILRSTERNACWPTLDVTRTLRFLNLSKCSVVASALPSSVLNVATRRSKVSRRLTNTLAFSKKPFIWWVSCSMKLPLSVRSNQSHSCSASSHRYSCSRRVCRSGSSLRLSLSQSLGPPSFFSNSLRRDRTSLRRAAASSTSVRSLRVTS